MHEDRGVMMINSIYINAIKKLAGEKILYIITVTV
jgi:hypothetical protein